MAQKSKSIFSNNLANAPHTHHALPNSNITNSTACEGRSQQVKVNASNSHPVTVATPQTLILLQ